VDFTLYLNLRKWLQLNFALWDTDFDPPTELTLRLSSS